MPGGLPLGLDLCNCTDQGTSGSLGTAITTGAANTLGNFIQLVASSTIDACWMIVQLNTANTTGTSCLLNIAVGGAGSEKIIASNLMFSFFNNQALYYSFPCSIPAGTRISAQAQSTAASDLPSVSVLLFDGALTQMEGAAGVDSIGASIATSKGTTVAAGVSGAKGAYVQLIASTPRDYIGLTGGITTISGQSTTSYGLMDIAIGGAGSEVAIVSNMMYYDNTNVQTPNPIPFLPILIPAGSRIAVRASAFTASAVSLSVMLNGVYR